MQTGGAAHPEDLLAHRGVRGLVDPDRLPVAGVDLARRLGAGSSYFTSEKSPSPGKVAWSTVAMGWPPALSDHWAAATPQCPAVRKAGLPSLAVTLKPREQRTVPPFSWAKMASPPDTNVLNAPSDLLMVATPEPRLFTVDSRVFHCCR